MNQQIQKIWQHSPPTIQAPKTPVKEVQTSLNQSSDSQFTAKDLLGLSWVLFEETD